MGELVPLSGAETGNHPARDPLIPWRLNGKVTSSVKSFWSISCQNESHLSMLPEPVCLYHGPFTAGPPQPSEGGTVS